MMDGQVDFTKYLVTNWLLSWLDSSRIQIHDQQQSTKGHNRKGKGESVNVNEAAKQREREREREREIQRD